MLFSKIARVSNIIYIFTLGRYYLALFVESFFYPIFVSQIIPIFITFYIIWQFYFYFM